MIIPDFWRIKFTNENTEIPLVLPSSQIFPLFLCVVDKHICYNFWIQIIVVVSQVPLFATPWTAAS